MSINHNQSNEGYPISEVLYIVLNVIGILGLFDVIRLASEGLSGFGDIAAALAMLAQIFLTLLSLPFLFKAVKRRVKFSWFLKYGIIIPIILLIESVLMLIYLDANFSDNGILIALLIGVNIMPFLIFVFQSRLQ